MAETKKSDRRYIGKIKNIATKNGGTMQKIYMDNDNPVKKDGQPNPYYTGNLIWGDAITGLNYQVKQLSIWVPKDGMKAHDVEKGFSCFITLDLGNDYEVTVLG